MPPRVMPAMCHKNMPDQKRVRPLWSLAGAFSHAPWLLACLAALVAVAGCAGYQFGLRSMYPQNVRYVHVPIFESDSLRRNFSERLTEAVVKQIELNTPYKVVGRTDADSILSGKIIADDRRVLVENLN